LCSRLTHARYDEIHDRYGSGHLVSRFISRATPLILEAVGQVNARAARANDGYTLAGTS
jgi:hypothetical protein